MNYIKKQKDDSQVFCTECCCDAGIGCKGKSAVIDTLQQLTLVLFLSKISFLESNIYK